MSSDAVLEVPYSVLERMLTFATPYDGDFMVGVGAGNVLPRMVRVQYPHSPIVVYDRIGECSKGIEHCFDRVLCYMDSFSSGEVWKLASLGRDGATLVVSFPVRPHWFESSRACVQRTVESPDLALLGTPTVAVVKTSAVVYAVARYSNYAPRDGVNAAGRDLVRSISFIQSLSAGQDVHSGPWNRQGEQPAISQALEMQGK